MIGQCGIPLKAFPTAETAAQNKQSTFLGIEILTHRLPRLHRRSRFLLQMESKFCSTKLNYLWGFLPAYFISVN